MPEMRFVGPERVDISAAIARQAFANCVRRWAAQNGVDASAVPAVAAIVNALTELPGQRPSVRPFLGDADAAYRLVFEWCGAPLLRQADIEATLDQWAEALATLPEPAELFELFGDEADLWGA